MKGMRRLRDGDMGGWGWRVETRVDEEIFYHKKLQINHFSKKYENNFVKFRFRQ